MDPVYLDYNATAPLRPEAEAALGAALRAAGNASSVHGFGRAQRRRVEEAREAVAALVGARPAETVFTGSGTEANNLALRGIEAATVLVSAGEHESVLAAHPQARRLPLDGNGVLRPEVLEAALSESDKPALVSVMLANNETGVIQPVADLAAVAHAAGALLHCDAVQAAGRIPVDMAELGVDVFSLSAHKLGGPQGVGALVLREGVAVSPQMRGGGQESRRRAGTENVAGIAGFGAAARAAQEGLEDSGRIDALRARLEKEALARVPWAVVIGAEVRRLPNTTCLALPGVAAETQVMALDLAGVAVSAGSACSSGKVTRSHVLDAMGVAEDSAEGAIRVSLGWHSSEADVERFLEAWEPLARRSRAA